MTKTTNLDIILVINKQETTVPKAKNKTAEIAKRKKKPTTSKDLWFAPGQAQKAAQEIEKYKKKRDKILNSI